MIKGYSRVVLSPWWGVMLKMVCQTQPLWSENAWKPLKLPEPQLLWVQRPSIFILYFSLSFTYDVHSLKQGAKVQFEWVVVKKKLNFKTLNSHNGMYIKRTYDSSLWLLKKTVAHYKDQMNVFWPSQYYLLEQGFSNFNVHMSHLGAVLKSRFWLFGLRQNLILQFSWESSKCWCCWSLNHPLRRKVSEHSLLGQYYKEKQSIENIKLTLDLFILKLIHSLQLTFQWPKLLIWSCLTSRG